MIHTITLEGLSWQKLPRKYCVYFSLEKRQKRIAHKHDILIGKFVSHRGIGLAILNLLKFILLMTHDFSIWGNSLILENFLLSCLWIQCLSHFFSFLLALSSTPSNVSCVVPILGLSLCGILSFPDKMSTHQFPLRLICLQFSQSLPSPSLSASPHSLHQPLTCIFSSASPEKLGFLPWGLCMCC